MFAPHERFIQIFIRHHTNPLSYTLGQWITYRHTLSALLWMSHTTIKSLLIRPHRLTRNLSAFLSVFHELCVHTEKIFPRIFLFHFRLFVFSILDFVLLAVSIYFLFFVRWLFACLWCDVDFSNFRNFCKESFAGIFRILWVLNIKLCNC